MAKDVEMKDALPSADKVKSNEEKDTKENEEEVEKEATPEEIARLVCSDIMLNTEIIVRSVKSKESRLILRVLRTLPSLRRRLSADVLNYTFTKNFPPEENGLLSVLLQYVPKSAMDIEEPDSGKDVATLPSTMPIPEVEVYLRLLLVIFLLDDKRVPEAVEASNLLIEHIQKFNRRTMDHLAARAYFYYARSNELSGNLADIRPSLLAAHRTASLRHDNIGQATLQNLLLRNYLSYNLYDQADKLVSKTTFPETASNNELARYLYYLGKIKSTQLDYSEAYECLMQAFRKAPQQSAKGFKLAVHKLATIVQLLLGEIPERMHFHQKDIPAEPLVPYEQLTNAVRVGDLSAFKAVMERHHKVFRTDKTYNLIVRLRHNVIKTGLRKINLSYSRISLADICAKLHLESPEDAEYIVAKAIRDGVIDATINHEKKYVHSKENVDIYSTNEPQDAFHKRITFCLQMHNDAIKAMRFPKKEKKDNPTEGIVQLNEEDIVAMVEEDDDEF